MSKPPEKMLNFKEVCEIVGISDTHPRRLELKKKLKKYKNPFSTFKIYKLSDVLKLIGEFEEIAS